MRAELAWKDFPEDDKLSGIIAEVPIIKWRQMTTKSSANKRVLLEYLG